MVFMEKNGTEPGGGRTMLRLRRKLCYSSKNSIYCDFNVFHFILVDPVIHELSFRTWRRGMYSVNGVPILK